MPFPPKLGHMNKTVTAHCAAGRVLHALQRKHQWLTNNSSNSATVFVIGGQWQGAVQTWIANHLTYCHRRHVAEPALTNDERAQKKGRFLKSLLEKADGSAHTDPSFYILSGDSPDVRGHTLGLSSSCSYVSYELPFTVAEAAEDIRRDWPQNCTQRCSPSLDQPRLLVRALSDEDSHVGRQPRQVKEFFDRCTADVVALDFSGHFDTEVLPNSARATPRVLKEARDAMTLSSYLLKPSGALLLRFPAYVVPHERISFTTLMRSLSWSYQISTRQVDGDYVYCMGCRRLAGDAAAVSPRVSDAKGSRWNARRVSGRRGGRSKRSGDYFAALMPSYTNAALVKEALERSVPGKAGTADAAKMDAEAFLNMSIKMAEEGAYSQMPDD